MGVAWLPDGAADPVPLEAAPGRSTWHVGAYRFTRCAGYTPGGSWICEGHGKGAGFCRTPVGAFLALRKFLREDGDL